MQAGCRNDDEHRDKYEYFLGHCLYCACYQDPEIPVRLYGSYRRWRRSCQQCLSFRAAHWHGKEHYEVKG